MTLHDVSLVMPDGRPTSFAELDQRFVAPSGEVALGEGLAA